jgi:hypothetical protein
MDIPFEYKRYALYIVLLYISIMMPRRIQHHNRVLLSVYGLGHKAGLIGEKGGG